MFETTSDWKAAPECEQLDLFSIPFLRGNLRDIDLDVVQQDCRDLVSKAKERYPDDNSKNYTTYFDEDLRQEMVKLPWYKEFSEQIKDTYIQFINTCYGQDVGGLRRSDLHLFAWISVYNKPHHHTSHNHINSYMSGTWYVKTDEESQPIKFENPNRAMAHALNLPVNEWGHQYYPDVKLVGGANFHDEIEFYPKQNQFLLWPSMLIHSVPFLQDSPADYERIAISFNLHHPVGVPNQNEAGDELDYRFLSPAPTEEIEPHIPEPELPSAVDDAAEVMSKPKGVLF